MLTRIRVKNFKALGDVDIELGQSVVLVGPNNSGKTAALQALALWEAGLRRWNERRRGKETPDERPGVTISRRDLISIPVPQAKLLWRNLHVREVHRGAQGQRTTNVLMELIVDGVTGDKSWSCGLEFYYANDESFYCRPLRQGDDEGAKPMLVPPEAAEVRLAFLPPMSGLAATEPRLEPGRVNVLIGEGQTAQVLRNLCHQVFEDGPELWKRLSKQMDELFGVRLAPPEYVAERGEITMAYRERGDTILDLSCAGRGLQQTLLLLAYLYAHPGAVLLLDEPDAHLEVLRQRQIYNLLVETAEEQGGQIVAATHSEIVLNEAADKHIVIAFVGAPQRIDDRGSQTRKALTEIGFDQYYQAAETGWVLYLEGSTDLAILQAFAKTLRHEAAECLQRPFIHYVGNVPSKAQSHFFGLKEAKPDLVGLALYDRLDSTLDARGPLEQMMWRRREIENYLCREDVLLAYAHGIGEDLFTQGRIATMQEAVLEVASALRTLHRGDPWSPDLKASDEFLDPLFETYFGKLRLPNDMRKTDYHVLAHLVPVDEIDLEIIEKLNAILAVAQQARRG